MKRFTAFVVALLALLALTGWAPYEPPPLRGHVVDGTNTLTPEQTAALDAKLTALREQTGFAIVVFIPSSLEDRPIEDVAYDTFNKWQVGEAGKDNGVLLLLAPNERRSRIETGKGLGGELTDLESAEILRSYVTPAMKDGDLARAADAGADAIQKALVGDLPITSPAPGKRPVAVPPLAKWIGLVGVLLVGILAAVSRSFRWALLGILQTFLFMRGGGGGLGGGGGGGYSGGGGRSGGGGANDSY